jgi:hypothetical protein
LKKKSQARGSKVLAWRNEKVVPLPPLTGTYRIPISPVSSFVEPLKK